MRNSLAVDSSPGDRLDLGQAGIGVFCGIVFGFSLHRSELWLPTQLIDTLTLRDMHLWKVLLAYIGSSMVFNAILSKTRYSSQLNVQRQDGLLVSLLGAVLVGIGMSLAGTDPLLLWIQLGVGSVKSWLTVIGVVVGVLAATFFADHLKDDIKLSKTHLHHIFDRMEFWHVALPMGLGLCLLSTFIEDPGLKFDSGFWKKQTVQSLTKNVLELIPAHTDKRWSPYTIALFLSLAQLLIRCMYAKRIQGYGGWLSAVNFPLLKVMDLFKGCKEPMFLTYTGSCAALWAFFTCVGIMFGGALSCVILNNCAPNIGSPTASQAVGACFFTIGAILAGGDLFAMLHGVAELHIGAFISLGVIMVCATLTPMLIHH